MIRPVVITLAVLALCGCNNKQTISADPPSLDALDREAARTDAMRYLGEGARLVAICGSSEGASFFLNDPKAGYATDGISDGIIVLAFTADGKPDVVQRDALKQMVRDSEEDGQVTFLKNPTDASLGTWVIEFPSTGILEAHNLSKAPDGQLYDLWTSTRPNGLLPGRNMSLVAKCDFA